MIVKKLDYNEYVGKKYSAEITSSKCLEITRIETGFNLEVTELEQPFHLTIEDTMLSDWLTDPVAFGAFDEEGNIVGFVEGFLEKWNNRYRISNICVFETKKRHSGIGQLLMNQILVAAKESGARMAVLETQSGNIPAISFYKKNGFEIMGFDLYAYSNNGPEEHNVRVEMGMQI